MNSDGSTNNLAKYICYSRETLARSFKFYYSAYFIWAYLTGLFCCMVSHYTFGEMMGSDGKINNLWNVGVHILIANIVGHHVQVYIETRNYNLWILVWYVVSFSCIFVTIYLNDSFIMDTYVSVYYAN